MTDRDLVREVRQRLSRPLAVAKALGLKVAHDGGSYALVSCPVHQESRASCSLHRRGETLAVKCHGCEWTGDLLTLVAAVNGLDPAREFRSVLAAALDAAGMADDAQQVRGGKPAPARRVVPQQADPEPERDYPPLGDVLDLWLSCIPVTEDLAAMGMLEGRRIDPATVARHDLARVIHPGAHHERVPGWAKYRGRNWNLSGHRVVVPVYDAAGQMRSVRAWLVTGEALTPKRVPPVGFRASALVLANQRAQRWLRGDLSPSSVVLCEGEPDWLVRSITFPSEVIVGVGSGSWTAEFAERVPYGSEITILTHLDSAGNRYADAIEQSVKHRAQVFRWTVEEPEAA